jgi:hypothetical protein
MPMDNRSGISSPPRIESLLEMNKKKTAGLPDFSPCNIPKREEIYRVTTKYTKMTIKYTPLL